MRKFVSIKLNPFLRVFAISAFLKVIHTPKTPVKRVFSSNPKINFPIVIFIKSQSGLPINIVYTLMTRINCLKVKKFRKKKFKKKKIFKKNFFFENFGKKNFFLKKKIKMADSKKRSFSSSANSQYFLKG